MGKRLMARTVIFRRLFVLTVFLVATVFSSPTTANADQFEVLIRVELAHPDAAWDIPTIYLNTGSLSCDTGFSNSECRSTQSGGDSFYDKTFTATFNVNTNDTLKLSMMARAEWPGTPYGAAVPADFSIKVININTKKVQQSTGRITTSGKNNRVALDYFPAK